MEANRKTVQPLVEIQLLGRFRVRIDGVAIDEKRWARRSAKSLVKLLALKPFHALHREQIMDLLWLEQKPETALNNLNKAIYGARRAFEPDLEKGSASQFLLTEKNQIILASPGSLIVDLDEFEHLGNFALQNNDLESGQKALEIYQGDLLTEDIYEDWIYTRRETMRLLFRKTATKIAGLFVAENNRQASIEILKKLACDDSSDEFVQRLLMRLYAETGSKYQALKQFQHCREALQALGIEPESETIKLEQSIKRGEVLPIQNGHQPTKQPAPKTIPTPRVTPLTFQNGCIKSAKFLSDGETAIFTADWNGSIPELYTLQINTGEIRAWGMENAEVLSVSPAGDLAVMLNPLPMGFFKIGTLAKLSADKSAVELLPKIHWADWFPLKNSDDLLAVVRDRNGKNCLEFPIDNVIYETTGWIGNPRFSPDGEKLAFIEHPFWGDDRGFVVLLDLENTKKRQILTKHYLAAQGLAWSNNEIWFTASSRASARSIKAVNLKGEERTIYRATGSLTLHDVFKNGRALVTDEIARIKVAARRADEESERNLSWHDWTLPRDLTEDGETLLFEEGGASGGTHFSAYTRKLDGSTVKKIGDGSALLLSPDGKYALLRFHLPHSRLALIPTSAGEIIELENDPENPLEFNVFSSFFPDGKQIMFTATDSGGSQKIYVQKVDGGKPVQFAPAEKGVEMLFSHTISPDGKYVVLFDPEKRLALYQTSDGAHLPLKNMEKDFYFSRWSGDGNSLLIWRRGEIPATLYKYDLESGEKEKWLEISPKAFNNVTQIVSMKTTLDGKTYVYSCLSETSDLFLMEDLE